MLFYKIQNWWLNFRLRHAAEEEDLYRRKKSLNWYHHNNGRKKIETSKLVLWFMLLLLLSIVFFTGYVTLQMMTIASIYGHSMDFTPLVALISAIVGQVIITLGYFTKSTKENSKDGITYLNAQRQIGEITTTFEENIEEEEGVG